MVIVLVIVRVSLPMDGKYIDAAGAGAIYNRARYRHCARRVAGNYRAGTSSTIPGSTISLTLIPRPIKTTFRGHDTARHRLEAQHDQKL